MLYRVIDHYYINSGLIGLHTEELSSLDFIFTPLTGVNRLRSDDSSHTSIYGQNIRPSSLPHRMKERFIVITHLVLPSPLWEYRVGVRRTPVSTHIQSLADWPFAGFQQLCSWCLAAAYLQQRTQILKL